MGIDKEKIFKILKKHWGYDTFRPLQLDIVMSILSKHDTLAILPTGGGKSLCYQLPGIYLDGLTLVISPLIALMKDQIDGLKAKGIEAIGIMSGQSRREQDIYLDNAAYGNAKFLFLSPERLKSKLFLDRIEKLNISLVAIDEAHCISEWGHDFRPEYREIALLREKLPNINFIALTATATPQVVLDIQTNLELSSPNTFTQSPIRSNLSYKVQHSENKKQDILEIVRKSKGCVLIYVQKRKTSRELQKFIIERKFSAEAFHGGLDVKIRNKIITAWNKDKIRIIIATKAFGMGMDKPNVRTVIHYQPADALEGYVQEAGRAGRDGNSSEVILLWNKYDLKLLNENINNYYPSLPFIQSVYHALIQYFKLGKGINSNDWIDFNLTSFSRFKKNKTSDIFYALNLLHKANYIILSSSFLHPSKLILFEINTKNLLRSEKISSKMKDFVKVILRIYDGIFLEERKIDEKVLAKKSGVKLNQVKDALNWLQSREVLKYIPAFDGHKISFNGFIHNSGQITLENAIYSSQKERLSQSIKSVGNFIKTTGCRQSFISEFFGFDNEEPCGSCDNCLKNNINITSKTMNYKSSILDRISLNNNNLDQVINSFDLNQKDVVAETIDQLIQEEIISVIGNRIYITHE